MEQATAARPVDVEVNFEVYVNKGGRWLIREVLQDREAALELAEALATRKEHAAVKVVREQVDPRTAESSERIIFDTAFPLVPPVAATPRPAPEPAPVAVSRPRPPEPPAPRIEPEPDRAGAPWLVMVSACLGLTFAALGFWFISAIG